MKKLIQILRESEEDDFDWVSDLGSNPLQPYFDAGYRSVAFKKPNNLSHKQFQKILFSLGYSWMSSHEFWLPSSTNLFAYAVNNNNITYISNKSSIESEYTKSNSKIFVDGLFNDVVTESEEDDFQWADDIVYNIPIGHWDGRERNKPNMGKLHMFTDSDGDNHFIRVGGIGYKHRTRRHDGTFFVDDGYVSFYDGSITQQQITDFNNTNENDPGVENRIEMSREEYNNYTRNHTLVIVPDNQLTESNEWEWNINTNPLSKEDLLQGSEHLVGQEFTIKGNPSYYPNDVTDEVTTVSFVNSGLDDVLFHFDDTYDGIPCGVNDEPKCWWICVDDFEIVYDETINESDEKDFDWVKDISVQVPITELEPYDVYRITTISGRALKDYLSDRHLVEHDIYTTVFKMDPKDCFTVEVDSEMVVLDYIHPSRRDNMEGTVWLRPAYLHDDELTEGGWVDVDNIMVQFV